MKAAAGIRDSSLTNAKGRREDEFEGTFVPRTSSLDIIQL